jgi:hypothetical protein
MPKLQRKIETETKVVFFISDLKIVLSISFIVSALTILGCSFKGTSKSFLSFKCSTNKFEQIP